VPVPRYALPLWSSLQLRPPLRITHLYGGPWVMWPPRPLRAQQRRFAPARRRKPSRLSTLPLARRRQRLRRHAVGVLWGFLARRNANLRLGMRQRRMTTASGVKRKLEMVVVRLGVVEVVQRARVEARGVDGVVWSVARAYPVVVSGARGLLRGASLARPSR